MPPEPALLLIDDGCGLCTAAGAWLQRRTRSGLRIRGRTASGLDPIAGIGAIILVHEGRRRRGSDAILRCTAWLVPPWPLAVVALAIAWPRREGVYRWIAAHRHRWSGSCASERDPSGPAKNGADTQA